MCNPIAMAAMYGIQAISSINAQNRMAQAEAEAASQAALADYNTLVEQQRQINQQTSLEKVERYRQAMRERSRLLVALGEAGVDGFTPGRELANAYLQTSYDVGIMEENRQNRMSQNLLEMGSVSATARSRANVARSKYISPLYGALMIGSAATQGYGAGFQLGQTIKGR